MPGFRRLTAFPLCVGIAVFLLTCLPQSVAAQDYVWSTTISQGDALLLYGPPGTDSGSFSLLCNNAGSKSELEIYAALGGAGEGEPLSIEISAASARVVIEGEARAAKGGGDIVAKAKGFAVKPLLAVINADGAPDRHH
jgi:hypothetical protein